MVLRSMNLWSLDIYSISDELEEEEDNYLLVCINLHHILGIK